MAKYQNKYPENTPRKLNLGCGSQIIESWINVDYALGAWLVKVPFFSRLNKQGKFFNLHWNKGILLHDLRKTFPWESGSVDIIYSSHTLEHFSKEIGLSFLEECYRVIKKGGIIRIIVPDLAFIVKEYTDGRLRSDLFIKELGVSVWETHGYLKNKLAPFISFPHKCMYDAPVLIEILEKIGFSTQRKGAFESKIAEIHEIELEGRTGQDSLIVEGIKK